MLEIIGPDSTILEVGSGPGWDADYIESFGMHVKRTDITTGFREIQLERGKQITSLNILTDNFGGPYDGVVALCVLLNIDRNQVESVITKVAQCLRRGGVFLVSIREGDGELWERSERSGEYHVVLWKDKDFRKALAGLGLNVHWQTRSTDSDGNWLTYLAVKN